ncbi:MAG: hypothetical protein KAJ98_06140, partial [Spirochaetaceae bacterium]|nr:hypothetical protein [Spirochaetaceae bacterium]
MTKPILLSVAIHVLILGTLFLAASIDKPMELTVDKVSIRILNRSESVRISDKARAYSPSESPRLIRQSARIPQDWNKIHSIHTQPVLPITAVSQQNMDVSAVKTTAPPQPPVNDSVKISPLGGVDPLAGLEKELPGIRGKTEENSNPWSLSWANGKKRDILSFPMIDADDFPEET